MPNAIWTKRAIPNESIRTRRPRVALVGNAPLRRDHSHAIDSCDVVVRCNDAANWGPHSGQKTDVLCITHTGEPAERFIREQSLRRLPRFPNLKELWFFRKDPQWMDAIVAANDLQDIPIRRMTPEQMKQIERGLRGVSAYDFSSPSTGYLAFQYILQAPEFEGHDKWLFGFNFQTWLGHPGHAEAWMVHRLCATRADLTFHAAPDPIGRLRQTYFELKYRLLGRLKPNTTPLSPTLHPLDALNSRKAWGPES